MARSRPSSDEMPVPSTDGPSGELPQFLRAADIGRGKVGATGTLAFLGEKPRKIESKFGVQYAFPVKMKGKLYDLPVKVDSGNHRRLFDRFGKKPPKGIVRVEIKDYAGRAYIAIV
jgi:hypothetical protein